MINKNDTLKKYKKISFRKSLDNKLMLFRYKVDKLKVKSKIFKNVKSVINDLEKFKLTKPISVHKPIASLKAVDIKEIRDYQKETLPIYTAVVIDPISRFVVKYILKYNFRLKPYTYTYFGLILSLISANFFLNSYFLIGAIFFQISIIFDCVDGYVARIQNTGSIFGIFSDGFVDFLRVFINLYALNISFGENNNLINLFTIYLLYIAFENTLNISLKDCTNYFKK